MAVRCCEPPSGAAPLPLQLQQLWTSLLTAGLQPAATRTSVTTSPEEQSTCQIRNTSQGTEWSDVYVNCPACTRLHASSACFIEGTTFESQALQPVVTDAPIRAADAVAAVPRSSCLHQVANRCARSHRAFQHVRSCPTAPSRPDRHRASHGDVPRCRR